jgi:phosphopantothenoylcysteine synthetase/decarboxylase
MLSGKCVVVGVCGGIAAYKAAYVVSALKKLGAEADALHFNGLTSPLPLFVPPADCV